MKTPKNKDGNRKLNQAALATACNVNRSTVTRWVRHPAWSFGPAPWNRNIVVAVKQWAESNLQEDRARDSREGNAVSNSSADHDTEDVKITLSREVNRRCAVHPYFFWRCMIGIAEAMDKLARPFSHEEVATAMKRLGIPRGDVRMLDWLEQEQIAARDAATTLTLASVEAVDHFMQTGQFQHLDTAERQEDVNEDLDARWERMLQKDQQEDSDD